MRFCVYVVMPLEKPPLNANVDVSSGSEVSGGFEQARLSL